MTDILPREYPVYGGPLDGAVVPSGSIRNGMVRLPARSRNYRWTDKSTVDSVWELCVLNRHEALFLYILNCDGRLTWVPSGVV